MTDIPAPENPPQSARSESLIPPLVVAALCLLFSQIAPRIHAESVYTFLISSVLYMVLIVWFAASLGRALDSRRRIIISGVLAALIAIPFRAMVVRHVPPGLWLHTAVPGLSDLLMVWLAGSIGSALSLLLRSANMIPPVAAVLALVDIWTVLLGGPVQQIMQSENPTAKAVTQAMTVQLAAPKTGAAPSPLLIGFADFLFIAFFTAAICRFVPNGRAYNLTVRGLLAILSAYLLLVAFIPLDLPALVPMAVAMIALHWRQFHYERSEAFALLYAGIFIALIAIVFWYFGRSAPRTSEQPIAGGPPGSTVFS